MNVVMIGSGYVGLVSGACFAEFGAEVTCVDVDEGKIARLKESEIPIYEPGLKDLVAKNVAQGRLCFTTELAGPVASADLVFIAVGTPSRHGGGFADLRYVYDAAKGIAPHLTGYTVVVDKSTVPVGTARNVARVIRAENPRADFDVASNPEFLREGAALSDFMRPDRVVIGVESERGEALLRELYRPLNLIETPILKTGLESAELIKYASNAFLATKISRKFLHPGPGYGGSCFPKDTQALVRIAQEHGVSSRIVEAVIEVNAAQKARMIKKIRVALGGSEAGKTLAVLGLTFKPETDDMRDAPALSVLPTLIEKGAIVRAHDPQGMKEARKHLPASVVYCDRVYDTFDGADAVVLMTEWNAYRGLDLDQVMARMRGRVFCDLRNVYEPEHMSARGFAYAGVGR
jgi:UDPglucose 6-dehydrogenase